jgi:uncharacterized membrane protein
MLVLSLEQSPDHQKATVVVARIAAGSVVVAAAAVEPAVGVLLRASQRQSRRERATTGEQPLYK